jgi:hypothetical protein
MENIRIPEDAIPYILYQRTGYLQTSKLFRLLSTIGNIKGFYKLSVRVKAKWFSENIIREYDADILNDFNMFKSLLPDNIRSCLDIGCGVAAIDVLISRHYGNKVEIYLIDKTFVENKIYYDYTNKGAFYNSLDVAKNLLEKNGVKSIDIHIQEATEDNRVLFHTTPDLVLSLLSWGFHYPILTYLDEVYNKQPEGGILIVDVRKKSGDGNKIKSMYGNIQIIYEAPKYFRLLARKQNITK